VPLAEVKAIGVADPLQRVAQAKARMDALKRSAEPVAMQWLLDIFGRGPKVLRAADPAARARRRAAGGAAG